MRRIWSALVPVAVVSLIVAGCGAATTTPGPSASSGATLAPELIKIKSSYGNVTPANLAPFYAKEMGIFAKHGLDVDLVLIDGGAPSAAALISGQIQFGNFGGTETMSGGAVYAGPGHPPDTVLLLKNGFKVIVDLAAEKIPATDNCTVVRRSYLQSNRQTVQAYIDAEIEAIAAAKKDKPGTIKVMSKLLKIEDQDALGQAYDFYVGQIMPTYPHLDPAAFNYTRDTLAATNPNVKNLDVTKAIDDSFVADAEKRGVGK